AGRGDLPADDGDSLPRLRAALGPDVLLGRHRHHQPVQRHTAGRREHRHLAVGRVQRGQPDAQPLLQPALPAALRDLRRGVPAHRGAARHRLEQPAGHRPQGAAGHAAVPPLLHRQGQRGPHRLLHRLRGAGVLRAEHPGPPGQLHPGQPAGDAAAHRAGVVLPSVLRHPARGAGQARRRDPDGRLHHDPVRAALARHQPDQVHALPAAGARRLAAVARVLLRADVLRREAAGRALGADRPDRHALLLRVFPGDPARARGQGAGLAVAGQHLHAGAAGRRAASGGRHGQADGEGV
ncbi:MAG: Ubiquinol-cytochrome C reductase, cytochrome B subunit, partial [uncultured Acetobacteraceae bacterium]